MNIYIYMYIYIYIVALTAQSSCSRYLEHVLLSGGPGHAPLFEQAVVAPSSPRMG